MKNLLYTVFLLLLFSACETRTDAIANFNALPILGVSEQVILSSEDMCTDLSLELLHGDSKVVYYDFTDDFIGDSVKIDYSLTYIEGTGRSLLNASIYPEVKKIVVENFFDAQNQFQVASKYRLEVFVTDYFGGRSSASVIINAHQNEPSEIISLDAALSEGTAYLITSITSDPDGDDVVAYEYLFDGTIMFNETAYESDNVLYKWNANPGCAAEKGFYIVSTSKRAVLHDFQETGVHEFSVRIKDARGLWSAWTTKEIQVD